MEDLSRRVLVAMVVGAAGAGAAMLTMLLVAPSLIAASAPETDGGIVEEVWSNLVGVLIGGMLSAVLSYVVAAAATLVALRATGCPRPVLAWLLFLALSPPWLGALSRLDLELASFVMLLGVLPAAVRLAFGYLEAPSSRADDLVS